MNTRKHLFALACLICCVVFVRTKYERRTAPLPPPAPQIRQPLSRLELSRRLMDCINKKDTTGAIAALDGGADPNYREEDDGSEEGLETLLIAAARMENITVAKCLIESGSDVNAKQKDGSTALITSLWTDPQIT